MNYLIYTIAIIALGLFLTKSKLVYTLSFFLLYIISTHFQVGNDLFHLENSFDRTALTVEAGERSIVFYACLMYLSERGLSFFQIRCVDFAIWSVALYLFILKFSKHPNYVISCSFLLPLLTFASQMRNGLTAAFLYLAVTCLFTIKNRKYGIVAYVLFVIIAGLFHYVGFAYLLGLLAILPINRSKLNKYVICASLMIFILYNKGLLFTYIIESDYYSQYGEGLVYNWRLFVILLIGILINYKFTLWAEKIILRNENYFSETSLEFTQFASRFYLIFMIFLPLLLVNGSIYRIYQINFVLSAVTVANASSVYRVGGKHQGLVLRIVYFCFYILMTAFYLRWQGEFMIFFNSIKV